MTGGHDDRPAQLPRSVRLAARVGLVARALFYLLLAGLAVQPLVGIRVPGVRLGPGRRERR